MIWPSLSASFDLTNRTSCITGSALSEYHEQIELVKWHKRHSIKEEDIISDKLKSLSMCAKELEQKALHLRSAQT